MGSYRSEDMVEALEWMLPDAADSSESIVVTLDWYAGHRTEEVLSIITRKGHVLIFHGGGTTPFAQVNDTHLHALLQRLLVQYETQSALAQRREQRLAGLNVTPKQSRADVCNVVKAVWNTIDHHRVATKGMRQTGPELPMAGGWERGDVFKDLLGVMNRISAPLTADAVSTLLRDEAIEFVGKGFAEGRWTSWQDAPLLIDEHDGDDDPIPEGLEAYGWDACDTDGEGHDDDDDDDDDDGGDGGGAAGGGPAGAGSDVVVLDEAPAGDVLVVVEDDEGAPTAGDKCGAGSTPLADGGLGAEPPTGKPLDGCQPSSIPSTDDVARAREILIAECLRTRDDVLLNRLLKQKKGLAHAETNASTAVAVELAKRAAAEREEDRKRVRQAREDRFLAEGVLEDKKAETARAQTAAKVAATDALQAAVVFRSKVEAMRAQKQAEKLAGRWLRVDFAVSKAIEMIGVRETSTKADELAFDKLVRVAITSGLLKRWIVVPHLWEASDQDTVPLGRVNVLGSGVSRWARCSPPFKALLEATCPPTRFSGAKPEVMLQALLRRVVPRSTEIFSGAYSPMNLLHANDYIVCKAFVYAVVALSKWLGSERFPQGLYGTWPPQAPADVAPPAPPTAPPAALPSMSSSDVY